MSLLPGKRTIILRAKVYEATLKQVGGLRQCIGLAPKAEEAGITSADEYLASMGNHRSAERIRFSFLFGEKGFLFFLIRFPQ